MSLRTYIQDHPTPLVWAWEATAWTLRLVKPIFAKMGMETSSKIVKVPEEIVKGLLFDCQDCAQCMLHSVSELASHIIRYINRILGYEIYADSLGADQTHHLFDLVQQCFGRIIK